MKYFSLVLLLCINQVSAQSQMSPKDEMCVQSAKTYSMLIEKKVAKASEAELQNMINNTNLPLQQKSRLTGLIKLLEGSEIRDRTRLVQEFYLKCSSN
jgi:hypothetical protein